MSKRIFTVVAACLCSAVMFAQSFEALWKQYKDAVEKDLPKTQEEVLKKISAKAEKDPVFNEVWKAVMAVLLAGAALISGYVFFGITLGGTNAHGYDDAVRLRLVKHSYYLWQDHKLYGVGLANWATRYVERYRNEYKTRLKAWEQNTAGTQGTNKKVPKKAEIAKKYSIEMGKEFAISTVIRHKIPHNSIAWFFTTTGVIGGIGYMTFVIGYLCLFLQLIKKYPEEWIVLAGFWVFVAVGIHGLVDVGIAYKAAARLLYLMLGLALCYSCYQKQNELTEN